MRTNRLISATVLLSSAHAFAEPAETLPIREITAFKDGHALVLRSGEVSTNAAGDAVLTEMPRPIMGAFWADESEQNAGLSAVTAALTDTTATNQVRTNADLIRANVGRRIRFLGLSKEPREGVIADIIEPGAIVVIEMQDETAALPIEQLRSISFLDGAPAGTFTTPDKEETLTLDLDWSGAPQGSADVSLMYIEKGFRWIPSYRVTILDDNKVEIRLNATLINELADVENVDVHMAVGVPNFAFANSPDPMGLSDRFNDLGMLFREAPGNQTAAMFSNSIRSQTAYAGSSPFQGDQDDSALPPQLTGSNRSEDLYVFTMEHVTLAKGARMSVPLVTYTAPVTSLYKLDLPGGPPVHALQDFNRSQHEMLAQLDKDPVARHVLRVRNENEHKYPITTAPATIFKNGRVLAQGLIRYAAPGGAVDLEVGSAVDISVKEDEVESGREPKALRWQSSDYARVDMAYTAKLTNRKPHAVTVEIEKVGFGQPGDAAPDAKVDAINVFSLSGLAERGAWWRWYGWPYYWHRLNGASRFRWTIEIEPGESADISAAWHYFWR